MLSSWEDDDQVHEHTKHKKHSTNFLHKWFSNYSHKPSQTPAPTPTPTQTPVPVPTLTATQPGITRPIPPHPPPNQPTHTSPPSSAHSRIHTHAGGHSSVTRRRVPVKCHLSLQWRPRAASTSTTADPNQS